MIRFSFKKKVLYGVFLILMSWLYRIRCRDRANIRKLKAHLAAQGSAIIVFNHISLDDAVVMLQPFYEEMGDQIDVIIAPGSRRHWGNLLTGIMMRLADLINLRVIPVVQHYERNLDSEQSQRKQNWPGFLLEKVLGQRSYLRKEIILGLDRQFVRAVHKVLAERGGIVLIAPEGHRREDDKIGMFQNGIGFLLRYAKNKDRKTVVVLVGIIPGEGCNRGLNLFRDFEVRVNNPLTIADIEKEANLRHLDPVELIRVKTEELVQAA